MGYALYEQRRDGGARWAGYGVPAECDRPGCERRINRGIAFMCGLGETAGEHRGGDCMGCGLFFCRAHRFGDHHGLTPKDDVPEWHRMLLEDPSWLLWREEHPDKVRAIRAKLGKAD